MALLHIDPPGAAPHTYGGPAWLALGFRPFYLAGAAFAALAIPLWLALYYGRVAGVPLGVVWHMHEMVFGFVIAIVVGFMYTAGRNWTGLWTPRGAWLGCIAGVWLAGRVAQLLAPSLATAAIDAAFLPLAAWPMYRVLARSGNARNMVLVVVLALLTVANLVFHAAQLGMLAVSPLRPVYAAIILVVVIETIIGGRVIPNFTANAVPGVKPVPRPLLERATMLLTILAGLGWVMDVPVALAAPLAFAAALAQAARLALWQPWRTLSRPILWILHISYAWIALGMALLGLAEMGLVTTSAAVHLLAVGALGGLIVGMITRTALGHTGRALAAGPADVAMYVLMQLAVLARLAAALSNWQRDALLLLAGACWSLTFLIYLAVYGPRLLAPRIDGREG
ncbi:NnrS family protein [Massilia sp. CF038]|uniref:NnrS family protein n=1 Tax=Massilia sp. CF038 TaxID=1881045 RepID=UPI000913DE83|nr:NnrS family protein [Massilia sp. CF038]SHG72676.1 uncharacterized protein involved in response to NO [Massilia sp. CF038]